MADHFFGINNSGLNDNGDAPWVLGTSTGATDLEVRIADAASWNTQMIANYLEGLADLFRKGGAQFPVI